MSDSERAVKTDNVTYFELFVILATLLLYNISIF